MTDETPFTVGFVRALPICATKEDLQRLYEGAKDKIEALDHAEKSSLRAAYKRRWLEVRGR